MVSELPPLPLLASNPAAGTLITELLWHAADLESRRPEVEFELDSALYNLAIALARCLGDAADETIAAVASQTGKQQILDAIVYVKEQRRRNSIALVHRSEPPDETDSPISFAIDYEIGDSQHVGTRFGGQPAWRGETTWPLAFDGGPMSFWGQFELPWDTSRIAFLFIDPNEVCGTETFELFVQPGGRPREAWELRLTGPVVRSLTPDDGRFANFSRPSFDARVPPLRPLNTPEHLHAERDRRNKIGGAPHWLQGDRTPSGHARFLFQFSAYEAGHDFADGAECFGFIDDVTGEGYFVWQCG